MLWRMSAGPTKERPMPLTEINVTNPPPVFRNAWQERDARRAAMPPPPPWPAVDPGLLEEGRPKLPAFPLNVFPGQWREWVKDAAQWAGSSEDYIAQGIAFHWPRDHHPQRGHSRDVGVAGNAVCLPAAQYRALSR